MSHVEFYDGLFLILIPFGDRANSYIYLALIGPSLINGGLEVPQVNIGNHEGKGPLT